MITTILRNATTAQILAARHHTANHLHIPFPDVTKVVAVAYVNKHFEQGTYENWDGFVAMLEADIDASLRRTRTATQDAS